jgi:hypothetical protein
MANEFLARPAEAQRAAEIIESLRQNVAVDEIDGTLDALGTLTQRDAYFFAFGCVVGGKHAGAIIAQSKTALESMLQRVSDN